MISGTCAPAAEWPGNRRIEPPLVGLVTWLGIGKSFRQDLNDEINKKQAGQTAFHAMGECYSKTFTIA